MFRVNNYHVQQPALMYANMQPIFICNHSSVDYINKQHLKVYLILYFFPLVKVVV